MTSAALMPLANTAVPLSVSTLAVALAVGALTVGLLVIARELTTRPITSPSTAGTRAMAVIAILGGLGLATLAMVFMAMEWRRQEGDQLWTGMGYWLPLALALIPIALGALRLSPLGADASRWPRARRLAWRGPLLLWAATALLAYLASGLQAHC